MYGKCMRASLAVLVTLLAVGLAGYLGACGSSGSGGFAPAPGSDGGTDAGSDTGNHSSHGKDATTPTESGPPLGRDASRADADAGQGSATLSNLQIVPANDTIQVTAGTSQTIQYKVMGVINGTGPAVDVTKRFVFYVPDNYLVGDFPTDGGATFTTPPLPYTIDGGTIPTPPQQGGMLTVEALGNNPALTPDGGYVPLTVETKLTVQLTATFTGPITPADAPDGGVVADGGLVPANAASLFGGAEGGPANPSYNPTIEYPNNDVMLPPNLKFLEVHWLPGAGTTLYKVSFVSAAANISYIVRCGTLPNGALIPNACALVLDTAGYGYLSRSNAGGGPVAVTVQATDDSGSGVGTSTPIYIQFAQESVNGAVYYWAAVASNVSEIMRFDFGGSSLKPELFLAPGDYGLPTDGGENGCIGCHALSPDGTKLVASLNGQSVVGQNTNGGLIVYLNDLAKNAGDAGLANTSFLTLKGNEQNHLQFASFNPSGSEFVAVYGDGPTDAGPVTDPSAPSWYNLWVHDGTTGLITSGVTLGYEPDHPSWSPDGTMIAVTHVGQHYTSQRERAGGIDVIPVQSGVDGGPLGLGAPLTLVPSNVFDDAAGGGFNRYDPSFAPDSSFLYYTETRGCSPLQWLSWPCDSDIDLNINATTWAIVPKAGATPIHLAAAAAPGLADEGTPPMDTFARSTPFETKQGAGKLFWFTVASTRKAGMREQHLVTTPDGDKLQQSLWMFAVDPAKILAGQDGSYPGFFLPFQDMTTSNHLAQWAQKIVSYPPQPPPPTPPPHHHLLLRLRRHRTRSRRASPPAARPRRSRRRLLCASVGASWTDRGRQRPRLRPRRRVRGRSARRPNDRNAPLPGPHRQIHRESGRCVAARAHVRRPRRSRLPQGLGSRVRDG